MRKNTLDKVINGALLALAKNPMATMDQIAESAQVGRATLFRYFPSKKALLRELSLEAGRRCSHVLAPFLSSQDKALDKLHQAVEAIIPLGASFHFLTYEPWHSGDVELEHDYRSYLENWRQLLEQVYADGHLASDVPIFWLVHSMDMLLYGAWEAIHNGELAPKQAAPLVLRTFLQGLGSKN